MTGLLPRGLRAPDGILAAEPFRNWPTLVLQEVEWLVGRVVMLRDDFPDKGYALNSVRLLADHYMGFCEALELPAAARAFEFIRDDLHVGQLQADKLADRLDEAARAFRADLEDRYFFRVRADRKVYFGADFGQAVTEAFPSALFDIREANTCFALERYVASILHAVRASEVVLHALAKERGVQFPDGPVAWKDWHVIIENIDSKVKAAQDTPPQGPQRDEFRQFYNGALRDLKAIKDKYRNVQMHARPNRKASGEADARDALAATRGLFEQVSTRLTENGRRINWKKKP